MKAHYRIGKYCLINNCIIGQDVRIWHYVNMYGCEIGSNSTVGSHVEIQENVKIGKNVIISSHSFLCSLVNIEDDVFIGHHVVTINDINPPSRKRTGSIDAWKPTLIKKGAVVGSNVTLLPVTIGSNAIVGAGTVVTRNVPDNSIVVGNPMRILKRYLEKDR